MRARRRSVPMFLNVCGVLCRRYVDGEHSDAAAADVGALGFATVRRECNNISYVDLSAEKFMCVPSAVLCAV